LQISKQKLKQLPLHHPIPNHRIFNFTFTLVNVGKLTLEVLVSDDFGLFVYNGN